LPGPQAKKFIGFQKSLLGRSCRGLRATFFAGFFGSVAAVPSDSGAAIATAVEASCDVPVVTAIAGAAGASARAVSVGCGAVAVTIIGGAIRGDASERAISAAFGAAVVTAIAGATRGGSERAGSADFGAVAAMVEASGFGVTRDGWFGRAGVTNDAPEDCTTVASDGS
jgi:hypothetical protein